MKIISFWSIVTLLFLIIFSCEKEAELTIPEPTPKLVVNSILEANELIKVYVGNSNYTLDNTARYINNATVLASTSNSKYFDTLSYADSGFYFSENIICKPGVTYTIKVITTKLNKVSINISVPLSVKFANYSFKENAGINKSGFKNKLLTVTIPDNWQTQDYYMLFLECYTQDSTGVSPKGYISNTYWYSYSSIIKAEGSEEDYVFSDELFNGKSAVIPMNFHMWNCDDFYSLTYRLKCYLVTISSDYYKYHKSYLLFQEAENKIWQVNSPPQLYSNIEDAFGICAAINMSDSIIIEF